MSLKPISLPISDTLERFRNTLPSTYAPMTKDTQDWKTFELIRSIPDWVGEIGSLTIRLGRQRDVCSPLALVWLGVKPRQPHAFDTVYSQMVIDQMPGTFRVEYFECGSRRLLGVEVARGPCLVLSPMPGISMCLVLWDAIHDNMTTL
jgi:hypothetical protein